MAYARSSFKLLQPTTTLITTASASANTRNQLSMILVSSKKGWRKAPRRRLITISTSHGKYDGEWSCDYTLSLKDLLLQDLVEYNDNNSSKHHGDQVSINLCIHEHASFGLSVNGRIITSFMRKCSICSSPYCRQIDTSFNVWILQSRKDDTETQLPEIGGEDPSVIYVKPGHEANLDSLVQDAIRLTTSVKDTCSESCEKSEPKLQYFGEEKKASVDKRWSRLLELRKRI